MTNTEELSLVKSENFGAVQCDFWKNESNDYFMTRDQIGTALGYTDPRIAITKIHNRNRDRLDKFSVVTKLVSTDGKTYSTTVYSSKGVYEICRFSRQPKADAFMDWVWNIIDNLRTGELQISNNGISLSPQIVSQQIQTLLGGMDEQIKSMAKSLKHLEKRFNSVRNINELRDFEIEKAKESGETFQSIADRYGVTKQRVHQIVNHNSIHSVKNNSSADIMRESIKPLIEKCNDKTNGGRITYRKVYDNMGISWSNRLKRYMHSHNLEREPSKFKLVESNYNLRLLFVKTAKRLLEES